MHTVKCSNYSHCVYYISGGDPIIIMFIHCIEVVLFLEVKLC